MRSACTRWTREQILSFGPFIGAEGDGGGEAGGTSTDPAGDGGSGTGTSKTQDPKDDKPGGAGKSDDLDDITDPDTLRRKLRNKADEQDRQYRKLQEAERERDELRAKQEEQERKGKSELELAKADAEKFKSDNAALSDTVRRLTVENAFLKVEVDWHDAADALRLIDLSDVEFDEKTREVKDPKKVAAAAKQLAKDKPHLVRSSTAAPRNTPVPPPGTTGQPPANGGQQAQTDRDKLLAKYQIRR